MYCPNLDPEPIPHGRGGGPCYQLMKANDPGATKIKVVGKFSTYKLFLMFKNSSNNIFGLIACSELVLYL
jgi:hypothetical protein